MAAPDSHLPAPALPDLVQRYLNGESIQTLADNSQHCFRTIYQWLLRDCGADYEHVQTQALINRIADADYQLHIAANKVSVARAREQAKFARMDFERRRPKLYGPKQEVSVDEKITVIVQRHPTPQHIDVSISSSAEKDEKLNEINVPNV